jgi:hypothetical protein
MRQTFKLDRRSFLQGVGVALALPLLESGVPRVFAAAPPADSGHR